MIEYVDRKKQTYCFTEYLCNRWEPCSYTFSAQTDALTYYRVEIVLSQESESNRFLRVVAKADLAPDTLDESARCCWEDAVNPASCLPDGCMIASTAF